MDRLAAPLFPAFRAMDERPKELERRAYSIQSFRSVVILSIWGKLKASNGFETASEENQCHLFLESRPEKEFIFRSFIYKNFAMHHHDEKPAFRCTVSSDRSQGFVRIGWSRFAATITEVSRDGFTLVLPARAMRKLSQGSKFVLEYSEEVWLVTVESRNQDQNGHMAIVVRREKDLTRVQFNGSSGFGGMLSGVSIRSADPVLSLGVVVGVTLIILICPGFGDELGTSGYLTELFSSSLTTVWDAVTGK